MESLPRWMGAGLCEGGKCVPPLPPPRPTSFTPPGRLPRFLRAVFSLLVRRRPEFCYRTLIQARPHVGWRLAQGFSEGPHPLERGLQRSRMMRRGLVRALLLPRPPGWVMPAKATAGGRAPETSSGPGSAHWAGAPCSLRIQGHFVHLTSVNRINKSEGQHVLLFFVC